MATNVTLTWTLPETRDNGAPMDPQSLTGVEVSMSADGGANFVVVNTVPPSAEQTVTVPDLEDGTWFFRFVTVDGDGKRSANKDVDVVIDNSLPGVVQNVQVTLG